MNQEKHLDKVLLSIGLILIFSSSSARYISEFKFLTEYLFHFGGIFIIIGTLKSLVNPKNKTNNAFEILSYLYLGFISLVILSMFVNQTIVIDFWSLEKVFLIYLFLVVFLVLTTLINEKLIINTLIISSAIVFAYFLIKYPISEMDSHAYKGGFGNPNSVGVLAATLFSVSLVAGTSLLKAKRDYLLATLYLLIAISAGYLVTISNSRTSFITIAIVLIIISTTFTYDILKKRNLLSRKSILFVTLLAFGMMSLFVLIDNPIFETLESTILDKFTRKIAGGDLTAGRIPIWTTIIEGAGLFGKGPGYFSEISGLGAHNSYLHILSVYGWLAAIAYTFFWIMMLIKSVQYYVTEKFTKTYALLPLIVIVNYMSLSMMENMWVHVSAFLAISMIAIFSKPQEISFII